MAYGVWLESLLFHVRLQRLVLVLVLLRLHQLHTDEYTNPLGRGLLADARDVVYGLPDSRRHRFL